VIVALKKNKTHYNTSDNNFLKMSFNFETIERTKFVLIICQKIVTLLYSNGIYRTKDLISISGAKF